MLNSRIRRVEEVIQQDLARIINYDLSDPRVRFVTVTRVKVSKDLSESIAFVSIMEEDGVTAEEVLRGLDAAKGYIKKLLAQRVVLKRLPDLHFRHDTTLNEALHIDKILADIGRERAQGETSPDGEPTDADAREDED